METNNIDDKTLNQRAENVEIDETLGSHYIGLYNIDQSIHYYLKNIIMPKIIFKNEIMNIPIMYGNSERWEQVRKHNYIRDNNGKIQLPLLVYRRTSFEKDTEVPSKKIQGENPQFFRTNSQMNRRNLNCPYNIKDPRYSQNNVLFKHENWENVKVKNDDLNIIIPNYVKLSYDFSIWTNYIEQMNLIIETLNFYADSYWGNEYFKFKTFIPSFNDQTDFSVDGIKIVKSECSLTVSGYIIPDIHTNKPIVTKDIHVEKVVLNERF